MTHNWALAAWSEVFTTDEYLANELWRWLGLFGILLSALIAGKVITFIVARQAERLDGMHRAPVLATLMRSIVGPLTLLLLAGALYASGSFMLYAKTIVVEGQELVITEKLQKHELWMSICKAMGAIAGAWFLFRLVAVIEYFLLRVTARTETTLDEQLVPLVRKTLRVFVVIVAGLFIAQNIFGWDVGAMIAGLGIGGLAVALAAKDALSNLFGSIAIFSDRPFHIGDRIKMGGHDGMVEEVGFRSTRIRTLEGNQVVIPNALVSNEAIENVGRRPSIRRILNVTITYDTPPEKVQQAVDITKELLAARMEAFPEDFPPRVYFSDFNDASLNIFVIYWFAPPDWWAFQEFNHELNMELLRRYNEAGIEFAFPTQTLYLKGAGAGSAQADRPA